MWINIHIQPLIYEIINRRQIITINKIVNEREVSFQLKIHGLRWLKVTFFKTPIVLNVERRIRPHSTHL